jgi:hypothetical protein
MFLVCLTLWNSVLGVSGGLSMCLHLAGELHLIETETAQIDCCHLAEQDSLSDCLDCNDVTLEGVDMLALRDSQNSLSVPFIAESTITALPEPVLCSTEIAGPHSPRGPPASIDTCLLVAEVVELRI